jgi:hypothetical protein
VARLAHRESPFRSLSLIHFEISEATDDERLALARGGYRLAEHRRDNGGAS